LGDVVDFLDELHSGPCLCASSKSTSGDLRKTRLSDPPRVAQRITCIAEHCPLSNPTWKRVWCNDLKTEGKANAKA